ncbi:MAG: DUF2795 domain-containing protein [Pseudomonadota bacterium]
MVVINPHRTTAIVIRHEGHHVTVVPLKSGRLSACRMERERFDAEWQPMDYDHARALDFFLDHARRQGASQEVVKALEKLARREAQVVASLF